MALAGSSVEVGGGTSGSSAVPQAAKTAPNASMTITINSLFTRMLHFAPTFPYSASSLR